MVGRLQGKVAVITGGCSGIGRDTVDLFIAEGARVVVADILETAGFELARLYPGSLEFIRCDVTQEADVKAAVARAVAAFGGLDITFNNAGAVGPAFSIETITAESWDRTMNVLLRGVMFGIKHSVAAMKQRGGGAIVNTASISGITSIGTIDYCTAKAGVLHLSRLAALQLAPYGIRVNSILPGSIPTPLFGLNMGMDRERSERLAQSIGDITGHLQPLQRAGRPRDIAEACLYLASDAAAFVTGIELRVDGGITLLPQMDMGAEDPSSLGRLLLEAAGKLA